MVLTDALIGTFTDPADPSPLANRCLLYHVIGDGTGDWNVPVGGMGAVTRSLADAARARNLYDLELPGDGSWLTADPAGRPIRRHDRR